MLNIIAIYWSCCPPVWHISTVTYGCPCGHSDHCKRLGVIWTRRKCDVLPFYILNCRSHEPLQGDASSDFKRNFNLDTPCYLSPSEPPSNCTRLVSFFPFIFLTSNIGTILRSDKANGASGGGGAATPGMSTDRHSWHRPRLISDAR